MEFKKMREKEIDKKREGNTCMNPPKLMKRVN